MQSTREVINLFFHKVLAKGQIELLPDLFHDEYQSQDFSVKKWERMALDIERDSSGSCLMEVVQAFHNVMEGLSFNIRSVVEENNTVAVMWTATGEGFRNKAFDNILEADWETDGSHFFELKDGKIYRLSYVADSLSAYVQGKMAFITEDEQEKMRTYMHALQQLGLYK